MAITVVNWGFPHRQNSDSLEPRIGRWFLAQIQDMSPLIVCIALSRTKSCWTLTFNVFSKLQEGLVNVPWSETFWTPLSTRVGWCHLVFNLFPWCSTISHCIPIHIWSIFPTASKNRRRPCDLCSARGETSCGHLHFNSFFHVQSSRSEFLNVFKSCCLFGPCDLVLLFFKHLFGFEFFISLLAARLFDTGTASLMAPKKRQRRNRQRQRPPLFGCHGFGDLDVMIFGESVGTKN